jgi:hypothetical protein
VLRADDDPAVRAEAEPGRAPGGGGRAFELAGGAEGEVGGAVGGEARHREADGRVGGVHHRAEGDKLPVRLEDHPDTGDAHRERRRDSSRVAERAVGRSGGGVARQPDLPLRIRLVLPGDRDLLIRLDDDRLRDGRSVAEERLDDTAVAEGRVERARRREARCPERTAPGVPRRSDDEPVRLDADAVDVRVRGDVAAVERPVATKARQPVRAADEHAAVGGEHAVVGERSHHEDSPVVAEGRIERSRLVEPDRGGALVVEVAGDDDDLAVGLLEDLDAPLRRLERDRDDGAAISRREARAARSTFARRSRLAPVARSRIPRASVGERPPGPRVAAARRRSTRSPHTRRTRKPGRRRPRRSRDGEGASS